jgi:trans-2,3-dihydro-3-hydroxyanthranilate isomerase
VVHDADGVGDDTMQAFARETRLSETTFVQSSSAADYRCRIWMTRGELDFAGHPSLGTAVAVALARGEAAPAYVQQTRAGLQPIDVEVADDRTARASMLQEPVAFGAELDAAVALAAAGVDPAHADPSLPAQVVSTGVPQVIVPVLPEALAELRADFAALEALLAEHDAVTLYLAAVAGDRARSRSLYLEPAGVSEDPATGSAAGPLMAYLHERSGLDRLRVEQGVEMGRPSVLECSVEGDRVRVGGDVVVVARGTVLL